MTTYQEIEARLIRCFTITSWIACQIASYMDFKLFTHSTDESPNDFGKNH
ncbi:hypothetical protein M5F54_04715 [Salmonella enterica]|nr:hypothetical protein [Salmonella enterica]